MKNLTQRIGALILGVTLLAGCASGPGYQEVVGGFQPIPADMGRIFVYRVATLGAAVQPKVRLNGDIVGKAVPKGFFYVDRPAGNYEISASTEAKRSLTFNLEPGDEKYVRLEMKMGLLAGHVKPVLVDSSVGSEEIKKTKFTELASSKD